MGRGAGRFAEYVGIDYSGEGGPDDRLPRLRVYRAVRGEVAEEVLAPGPRAARRWSRRALGEWLLARLRGRGPAIVGIDHCFSFPSAYLERRGAGSWDSFLDDFCGRWPTEREAVERCRAANAIEDRTALRLCDRWTSSAKSVFLFDVNGSVAKSSHAGIPWLRRLRSALGGAVHFWPFDGWRVPRGRHVVAEVYPSIFRNRFPREGRTADQHDAFAVAEWLRTRDALGALASYLEPRLTEEERRIAELEGWILGIL